MANKEKSWVREINDQIKDVDASSEHDQWIKYSIYKVPDYIKDLNPKAYTPQVISFGPFHYNEPQLKQMEMHKHRALLHRLKRVQKSFDEFMSSLEEIVQELQDVYQCLDEKWKSDKDEFLKLMIVDGCFMLEILQLYGGMASFPANYASTDPIFSVHGMVYTLPYIKRDMLMIENQLPLLVLKKLISVESGEIPDDDQVNSLVLKFCAPKNGFLPHSVGLGLHPLDLYRKCLLLDPPPQPLLYAHGRPKRIAFGKIRSAVELNEAGVRFKKCKTNNLSDISFHNGVLKLPEIVVDDATEYIYLNLMAFERLHMRAGPGITSFVLFMYMIDSAKDVALLNRKGIILNIVGSNEAVAELFKRLTKHITLDLDSLSMLMLISIIKSVDHQNDVYDIHWWVSEYCRKDWNMWRANLIHTYFRNPWSALSLAAALFLLVLALVQTVFTVLPYYHS